MEKEGEARPTVRFKSQSRYRGSREVKMFRGDGWRSWLEFQLELQRLFLFLGLDQSEESMRDFQEIISQLLTGSDLDLFNDRWSGAPEMPDILYAMNAVGRRYCPVGTRDVLHEEIKNLRKRRNMSVEEYDAQFQQLLRLESWLPPRDGVPMTEEDQCRHYSAGMPRTWQVAVVPQQSRWSDLRRLKTHYMQAERVEQQGGKEINRKSKGKRDQHHHSDGKKGKNKQSDEKKRKRNTQEGCKFCRANGNVWNNHGDDECFRNPKSQSYRPRSGRNKQDSTSAKRTEPRSTGQHQAAAMKSETSTTNDPDLLSYWQTEHGEQGAAMRAVGDGVLEKTLPALVVKVTLKHALNKQTYTALLDTGATSSLVREEVASWYKPQKETTWYRNVNNELQPAKGAIELPFVLPGFSDKRLCVQTCKLVEQLLYPLILGTDFLQQQGVVIDYQTREIRWDGLTMTMQTAPTEREKYNKEQEQLTAAMTVDEGRTMRILDMTKNEINLQALIPKEHLSSDQKINLMSLLESFKAAFQRKMGTLKLEPYRLPVKPGSRPRAQRPYQVPLVHREAVLKEVNRLVELGVLEPDKDSEWASPAFVILKKDGTVRFLTDFRALNRCLERRYFPLNKIQDMMRELPQPKYVSALDLVMGYYSRVLAHESRPYTAVVLPWGKFRYCRLPMGVSTAPDEFHAVMQQLLGELDYVRVYLDDVLVLSSSFEEHLEHLRVVLTRLQEAGLVINATKSKFCMKEVEYLGYIVSAEGKRPITKKIDAIMKLDRPKNIRDLRRFIGMVNYYKDMWHGRSRTLAPLTALTSIKRPYQWTVVEQEAFENAKKMIAEQVLLAYPDFNEIFDLYTDASAHQLGGVIMQKGRPLAFWSRKCTATQQHYTMNKKELLSVREMLREFRSILWGRRLRIFMDHKNSIQSTFNNEQTLRWRLEIEEFGPEMVYIRGHENIVADALSRLPTRTSTDEIGAEEVSANTGIVELPLNSLSLVDIAETQRRSNLHEGATVARRAIGNTSVLVSKANGRIILPLELVNSVLHTYHEWLMHPGELVMRESLKATLTWPGMTEAIRQWVRNCKTCARSKDRGPKYGKIPVKTMEVRPWAEIAVDSLGPLGSENRWRALTIIDTSTRLVEIINMDDGTSAEAARIVDQQWFNRYPRPERCIYDQGPEFRAEFQELLQSYGVEYAGNTAKNPQANGVIERVHRTINNKLRTTAISNRGEWENCLSSVMFALRAQYHTMTKMSPSQAVFGREMLFDVPSEVDWQRQQKHKELQVKRANAKENAGRKEHEYKPEDLVMVARSNQRAPKLQPLFDGPFRVFSVRSDGILVIDKRKYQESIHMRRVKPFQSSSMGEDVVTS